jgi:hypothetical protein
MNRAPSTVVGVTVQPDTTSGGSHRQNRHAGDVTTAALGNSTAEIDKP